MAVRSGAGTGVVVSLVVFVLCTVFLLVLTIAFHASKTTASQERDAAESTLARFVTPELRNREDIKVLEGKADPRRGQSVVHLMQKEYQDLMRYVLGDGAASYQSLQNQFMAYDVPQDGSVSIHSVMRDKTRDLRSRQTEKDGLASKLIDRENEISELNARLGQTKLDHQDELEAVSGEISTYREAAEEYRSELQEVKGEYYAAIDRHREQYEGTIAALENEKDTLHQQVASLIGRVDELQSILSENRLRVKNPSMLVDGHIIDATGSNNQVFIDRGKKHRIVLGMTFEVYDRGSAIAVDRLTGEMPRGKASLQVIKVAETTSTCKITRAMPGRPVVREDVIANAVYDPDYVFKFMVHGKFDVDGDGRPSEAEAEYLRSLVIDWGGAVVSGEQLPGDLDFLVLGVEPPLPPPLPADAGQFQIDDWVRKRRAHEQYNDLFKQAREAQIPVLNANRFFILTGHTDR